MSKRLVNIDLIGESWYNFAVQHREVVPLDSIYSGVTDRQGFLELWVNRHSLAGRGGYNAVGSLPVKLYTILETEHVPSRALVKQTAHPPIR